jgi:hypothetical protein
MASPKSSAAVATRRPPKNRLKNKQPKPAPAEASAALYSVHPSVAMIQKWIADLKSKTGCSLEEWIKHFHYLGLKDEKLCREFLIAKHKLGTNTAWWIAEKAFAPPGALSDDTPESYLAACPAYVANMYAGTKAALRPIHDAIVKLARQLGSDVKICPCKTIVPLYRRHVFAEIKPATNRRIDLGFALEDEPFTSRLLDTGGRAKKNRITHRVALTSPEDIDLQVKRWLKQAYERDG